MKPCFGGMNNGVQIGTVVIQIILNIGHSRRGKRMSKQLLVDGICGRAGSDFSHNDVIQALLHDEIRRKRGIPNAPQRAEQIGVFSDKGIGNGEILFENVA